MKKDRTGFYPAFVALVTLMRREVLRFLRLWLQTLLPPAITMCLYFLIFGKFIGSQIREIDGFTYIQYITPGLVMMSIMTNAYANTSGSFFIAKFNRSVEEMIVAPMPNYIILLGYMISGASRGLAVGLIVTFVALFFTHVPVNHPLVVLAMAALASMVFSLGGLINAIYAKRFDDIAFIPTFVLTPLTYLGGVFYSINQLPVLWRNVSIANPIVAMVDTFRYGLLGISDFTILSGFTVVGILFILLFIWCWILLKKGIGLKS